MITLIIIPSKEDVHPLTKSQYSSLQVHVIWHSDPYEGKGHLISQFTQVYPSSHAQLIRIIIKIYRYIVCILNASHVYKLL